MKNLTVLLTGYTSLLIAAVFFSYTFLDPAIPYLSFIKPFIIQDRLLVSILYIAMVVLLTFFFGLFLRILSSKHVQKNTFQKILVISLILLFSYPAMLSYDIYNYIATAKVAFFYLENPYIVMPIEFVGDPILSFMHAANKTALYGPIWVILTSVPFLLSFQIFLLTLVFVKLLVLIFYMGTIILLWKMTKNVFHVALFALHPLVLIETLISSHNDIVMMFFALLSFYFLKNKKVLIATIFLALSILIKFATLALVPVFVYTVIKIIKGNTIQWKRVFLYGFVSMLVVFLFSFLREEIYPWYAIWFLVFLPLLDIPRHFVVLVLVFTMSLLFRYVPFMLLGTHFGPTPYLKWVITFAPASIYISFIMFREKWGKI